VANRVDEFRSLGFGVVVVSMSMAEGASRYLARTSLPFPLLADPGRQAYAAFGLERTTWGKMIRPGTMWRYTKAVLGGGKIRPVAKGEDPLQTGGDFLIGCDRRIVWGHTTPDPTGRPTVDSLLHLCHESMPPPPYHLEPGRASGENPVSPASNAG
jgi:hypothetical protein